MILSSLPEASEGVAIWTESDALNWSGKKKNERRR
jgi:hypothetical protein